MIWLPVVALVLGMLIGFQVGPVTGVSGQYLAVACIAGLDTILGGIRTGLEGKFHTDVFITGFVSNTLIAFFLAWMGDQIGINLFLVAAIVLGTRIFTNLSLIRRYILTKIQDERERRKLQQQQQAQAQQQTAQVPAEAIRS